MLIGIIGMLVLIGIEITEGLGWLTAEDWLNDLFLIVCVVGGVIALAAISGVALGAMGRRSSAINWQQLDEEDAENKKKD